MKHEGLSEYSDRPFQILAKVKQFLDQAAVADRGVPERLGDAKLDCHLDPAAALAIFLSLFYGSAGFYLGIFQKRKNHVIELVLIKRNVPDAPAGHNLFHYCPIFPKEDVQRLPYDRGCAFGGFRVFFYKSGEGKELQAILESGNSSSYILNWT